MGFLGKILGKSGKNWFDCGKNIVGLSGTISRLPAPQVHKEDGLFGAYFVPDDKAVLTNRHGVRNQNDMMELRFKLDKDRGQEFLDAFKGLMPLKVQVAGALINDDEKDSKTELHPLDALWAPLPVSAQPAWVAALRGNLKNPGADIQVFRVLAVSDASISGAPAPSEEERKVRIPFAYPPGGAPNLELKYEIKPTTVHNTEFQLNHERIQQRLELVLDLKPAKKDGPSVFVADVAIFWN